MIKIDTNTTLRMASGFGRQTGLTLRLARLEDRQAVLNINQSVYDGIDYLTTLYTSFLHDKNVVACVAEMDGQIVRTFIYLF